MGEIKLFQICFEGDLTVEVSHAMRRLGAEPNFDQSWQIWLPEGRHAAPLVRYLRSRLGEDARLLVACAQFTIARDFLLIRHSQTPGADYSELPDAIARLGTVVELPFESTFIVQSELCPDDSLMVLGVSHDWAYSEAGISRMHVAAEQVELQFRTF